MPKTILLVDDSPIFRQVVAAALVEAGYDVVEAANGKDGLILLDGRRIHLIVSDLNMPILDGLAFVRCVRGVDGYQHTPVVMMTTVTNEEKRDEALAEGIRAWITKPFKPETLIDAVAKIL
ncbi:MAG TPA: response regulator [Fibrobacteria bacterium]|nr:response regulator [Fibrobacteria bacterium]